MGPNYGILQPIPVTAKVVGSAGAVPADNSIAQGAAGLLQGLQVGSATKLQKAQTEAQNAQTVKTKQETAQSGQLFPLIMQQTKNTTDSSNMDLASKKQAAVDQAGLRAAALQGPDQYGKILQQQDPKAYQDYQLKSAQIQNSMASLAGKDADNKGKVLKNYDESMDKMAQVSRAAAGGADPEMKQRIWTYGVSQLPKDLQTLVPPQYDQNTAMALSRLGHEASMTSAAKELEKNPSAIVKNTAALTEVQNRIKHAQDAGMQPDPTDVQAAGYIKAQILKDTAQPVAKPASNPFDNAAATAQMGQVTKMDEQSQSLQIVHDDAVDAKELLDKVPAGYVGPLVDYFKANGMNSEIQKLQKLTAGIPIAVKAMYGVTPGNRLTATELQQLNKASGSTAINKDSLIWVLDRLIPQTAGIMHDNWEKQVATYKNTAPDVQKNWLGSHPEPEKGFSARAPGRMNVGTVPDGRIKVKSADGRIGHIPQAQLDEAMKAGYTQVK